MLIIILYFLIFYILILDTAHQSELESSNHNKWKNIVNNNNNYDKSRYNSVNYPYLHNKWEINSVESVTESTDSAFYEYNEMNAMALVKKSSSDYQPSNLNLLGDSIRDRNISNISYQSSHKNELEKQLMYNFIFAVLLIGKINFYSILGQLKVN